MAGLIVSRTEDEGVWIGDDVRVSIVRVDGCKVRMRVEAPKDVIVDRDEVRERRRSGHSNSNTSVPAEH